MSVFDLPRHFRSGVVEFDYPADGVIETPAVLGNDTLIHRVVLHGPRVNDSEQLAHRFGLAITSSKIPVVAPPRDLLEMGHLHMMGDRLEHRPFGEHEAVWKVTSAPGPVSNQVCVTANGLLHLISWGKVTDWKLQDEILETVRFVTR